MSDQNSMFAELKKLNERTQEIVTEAHRSSNWKTAYDLIFSKEISRRVFDLVSDLNLGIQYVDPDTSYDEDVLAFSTALSSFVESNQGFFVAA